VIDDIRTGRLTRDDTAVYIHTGGLPLLFNTADYLWARMR
jgi:1-aminocyclopropane-1-carboxylate deaminase/D-cysteine desulfhydrase-like pyridoxal-dependent ACC family enzyme